MKPVIDLENISEEDLSATRICDLPLKIEGTWLAECIAQLYKELDDKGIIFKPECYLADEWLTPEGETCVGIPFYLAHPVLTRLEKKIMIEAEGDTKEWCMKLLRHEAGHAIEYAYDLHKRAKWRRLFGPSSLEYADTYKFRPYSKNYVRHLEGYYAQYHPDEDFVETFAVWLTPGLNWRELYKGWKALAKLEYVDELMGEIRGKAPAVGSKRKYWRLSILRMTLRNYYKKKRHSLAEDFPDFHDWFLKKLFASSVAQGQKTVRLSGTLVKYRRDILESVARYSGERKYMISDLLKGILARSRQLKIVTADDEPVILSHLCGYVTSLVMNYLYTGRFRGSSVRKGG
ncbi:MAG TPA: hypothetical protein DE315_04190 [Candidatus Omnitrophica bacterium]|nr:MAG: hypothetical protein A2Y05_04515 [Omnitrophica WOR_2 bacterium GWA2_53_43]HBO97663.1 hypothetical protein [Candidatus Omnitrophota bacterium]HCI44715.1 hypothetical protein [Candidatus Omnitrophota bacterium]